MSRHFLHLSGGWTPHCRIQVTWVKLLVLAIQATSTPTPRKPSAGFPRQSWSSLWLHPPRYTAFRCPQPCGGGPAYTVGLRFGYGCPCPVGYIRVVLVFPVPSRKCLPVFCTGNTSAGTPSRCKCPSERKGEPTVPCLPMSGRAATIEQALAAATAQTW